MKILSVTVKPMSAIDRLANDVKKYNEHLDIEVMPIHPKRESEDVLKVFEEKAKDVDILDFQYWKSAEMLLNRYPSLLGKLKILSHYNPYDIFQGDWKNYDIVVTPNRTIQEQVPDSVLIPLSVDLNFFRFNEEYVNEKRVLMVVARIEGKKGVREVAEVCKELGYKFILIGQISRPEYYKQFADKVMFRENVSEDDLLMEYHRSTVLVCNSVDNFESGTLPILEAMSAGLPVLTRSVGHVPDLYNMENMVVRHGSPEDKEELRNELQALMDNKERREKMRYSAYRTVLNYSAEKRARAYSILWNRLMFRNDCPLMSVIVPTYNRRSQIIEIVKALNEQSYPNLEIIIADDNSDDGTEKAVKDLRKGSRFPIKYTNTEREGYNLAVARNMAIIEAEGIGIVFLDSRLKPDIDAVTNISRPVLSHPKEKIWSFGNKGGNKHNFVENFSCIMRENLINSGMFNERIDRYGGMTQEARVRFTKQGYKFKFAHNALALEILSSKNKNNRLYDIYKSKLKLWKMYET
jgi:glycosyltransferase involved in cell wall biosynthesis